GRVDDVAADHGSFRAHPDQRRVVSHPMATEGGQVVHRLDQVGLALAVRADERGDAGFERQLDLGVRPEIRQRQVCDVHSPQARVSPVPDDGPAPSAARTACPPNSLRSAATAFMAGESDWREANRAKTAAVMAGAGTAWSMASWTVHRPSPESS